jgi:DNA-binding HxlR family transcriptional regulator
MTSEKTTDESSAPRPRWYEDACAAAHALDLVGERWALLVMRELLVGPKRFSDLRAGLPGISASVLSQRLEGLEAAGVLVRRRLPPPAPVQV